jgi:arabinogalactan endo-1,4-beta-galactosidase
MNILLKSLVCYAAILLFSCNKPQQVTIEPTPTDKSYAHTKFVMGADLSYVNAMQDFGASYSHAGKQLNPYSLFKQIGTNTVRVRLWHNPSWQQAVYGNKRYSELSDVIKTIEESKKAGMAVCLDIHYSDDWADPQKQFTPQAWKNLNTAQVIDSVYAYTKNVLTILNSKNLMPEYIQVGNETNNGMVHPHGQITNNDFSKFAKLVSSGIKAVRDVTQNTSIKTKIILHSAQLQHAIWWFDGVTKAGVTDFDIIGLSHYDKWSEVHTMAGVTDIIKKLKSKHSKDVMIVETATPWTNDSKDSYSNIIGASDNKSGYPTTPQGQKDYMIALTQAIIDGGGKGVMYWEPAWVSTPNFKDRWGTGSSWENNTYFDFTGKTLPVVDFMLHGYKF